MNDLSPIFYDKNLFGGGGKSGNDPILRSSITYSEWVTHWALPGKNHENASLVINPEFPALLGGIVQGFFIDFGSMTRFWVSGNKF